MLRRTVPAALLLTLGLAGSSAPAATYRDSDLTDTIKPPPDPRDQRPVPKLELVLSRQIAVPGPIAGGARGDADGVEVPVGAGRWRVTWTAIDEESCGPARAGVLPPGSEEPSAAGPVLSPDGRHRLTALPDGWLLAEKRRRRGWRRDWRLRVAGRTVSPPVVTDSRVYFGATDNRIYAVKLRNGHRVWDADVDGRASRRPVLWHGSDPSGGDDLALLLVVPDHGSSLIAIDAASGRQVAAYRLDEQSGALVGGAVPAPGGRVVIALQSYVDTEAALLLFELRPPASEPDGTVAYNPSVGPSDRPESATIPPR